MLIYLVDKINIILQTVNLSEQAIENTGIPPCSLHLLRGVSRTANMPDMVFMPWKFARITRSSIGPTHSRE